MKKILAINPGSTSTKISVFFDNREVFSKTIRHSAIDLEPFDNIADQYDFRKNMIVNALTDADFPLNGFNAIIGRGGLVRPLVSGTYEVSEKLKRDLIKGIMGQHASNLGGLIALELAKSNPDCKAYISDPVVVDEFEPIARVSGHPLFERKSIFHALNQKAIARRYATEHSTKYEEVNLVIAHMGGGISVGAHKKGRVVDVNNAVDGCGPFSPERAGTIPAGDLAKLCFSGKYTLDEVKKMLNGQGGLMAHLGINQAHIVQKKAEQGDKKSDLILSAMAYGVGKIIGSMYCVLDGDVDAIILTGGIANNTYVVNKITKMVSKLAPIKIYPGEVEMSALAENALRVLNGEEACKVY